MDLEDLESAITDRETISDSELALWFDVNSNFLSVAILDLIVSVKRFELLSTLIKKNSKKVKLFENALRTCIGRNLVSSANKLILNGVDLQEAFKNDDGVASYVTEKKTYGGDVYVWGSNSNYTLGLVHGNQRDTPEPISHFINCDTTIKEVSLSPFHSVFLDTLGRVWACGVRGGGRLGLPKAALLLPTLVPLPSTTHEVVHVSVSSDHTIILTAIGAVYTCGDNHKRVLGHSPPPQSKDALQRIVSLEGITGIKASKVFSVFWNSHKIWMCGENIGQMGPEHTEEEFIISPKLVSCIRMDSKSIKDIYTGFASTVVLCTDGHLYLLYQHRCTRITYKPMLQADIILKAQVSEKSGELKIVALNAEKRLLIWKTHGNTLKKWYFELPLQYDAIADFALSCDTILLATTRGAAFTFNIGDLTSDKDHCEVLKWKKLPHVYRALKVCAEPIQSYAWAVLQEPLHWSTPENTYTRADFKNNFTNDLTRLLEEANEFDLIHDIIFVINDLRIAAHKTIVCKGGNVFRDLISSMNNNKEIFLPNGIDPVKFKHLLRVIYTNAIPLEANDREVIYKNLSLECLLKTLENYGEFDTKLIGADKEVTFAHRAVLAARSSFFEAMLARPWKESHGESTEISIGHIRSSILKIILQFMYTADIDVSDLTFDEKIELFIAADSLLLNDLTYFLEIKFSSRLLVNNRLPDLITLSLQYNAEYLFKQLQYFIRYNLPPILDSKLLQTLDDNILEKFDNDPNPPILCRVTDTALVLIRSLSEAQKSVTLPSPEVKHKQKTTTPKSSRIKRTTSEGSTIQEDQVEMKVKQLSDSIRIPSQKLEVHSTLDFFPISRSLESPSMITKKPLNAVYNMKFTKLSQKQRKMLQQPQNDATHNEVNEQQERKTWQKTNDNSDNIIEENVESLKEIMLSESRMRKKAEWQMRKPLEMTQTEERAIRDLRLFYGADTAVDEIITVARVVTNYQVTSPKNVWHFHNA